MKRLSLIVLFIAACVLIPTRAHGEWDWTDTGLFRDALKLMERETKAQESIAKSLDTIAKTCNKN